ncbi:MAG: prolyl oligopeptidase family serine peptidase [Armatimonadota bacterium]|nr:prolyl oligopeptidase family serine peptidase [Armatimonadota bacterium]
MNTVQILLGAACGILVVTAAMGEPATDTQTQCTFNKTITKTAQGGYLLYLPPDYGKIKDKHWPLLVFLHGAGERGNDLEKVKLLGPPRMVADGKKFPFILVSPQCPEDSWWTEQTDVLAAMIDEVEAKYSVDKRRIYLTGVSMGGFGAWALATRQPKRFAAIAPICGAGQPYTAYMLKDIPMWVFHGDKDNVVPPAKSQEMVDAVRAAGGNPKFTLYPGVGHYSWDATYGNPEFWKWLLDQRRK